MTQPTRTARRSPLGVCVALYVLALGAVVFVGDALPPWGAGPAATRPASARSARPWPWAPWAS